MNNIFLNNLPLLLSLAVVFIIRQVVTWRDIRFIRYITTPLVTTLILAFAFGAIQTGNINYYSTLIFWGLVMSLVADTVLMIKEVDTLPYGLIYFLSAHVLYILAFLRDYHFKTWNILIIAIIVPLMIILFKKMLKKAGSFAPAVFIYMSAISIMVFLAIGRISSGAGGHEFSAAAGGVLFLISDIILGINAFFIPINRSSVYVWFFYAPGQFFIALSCV